MNRHLLIIAVAAMALTIGKAAMAIEEPAFDKLEQSDSIEIRQYRPFIIAETVVDGDMSTASNAGFRLIADYIFGNNLSVRAPAAGASEKIAMTAPVSVEPAAASEKIAMTAPVSVEPQGGATGSMMNSKRWRVHFTMPAEYTMATLPKPRNPAVTLREVPGKRMAVVVFSGFSGEDKVQQKTDELVAWLKANNKKPVSTPQLARYNPPWTLPFMRRNEVLIEIAQP